MVAEIGGTFTSTAVFGTQVNAAFFGYHQPSAKTYQLPVYVIVIARSSNYLLVACSTYSLSNK